MRLQSIKRHNRFTQALLHSGDARPHRQMHLAKNQKPGRAPSTSTGKPQVSRLMGRAMENRYVSTILSVLGVLDVIFEVSETLRVCLQAVGNS